ncbi:MAG: DEAD/DEAH box helicase [Syntrophobacterales bacterium]|nr:DEAD/DEAH box helicase [Syntrophobacterales bacterium]
MKSFIASRKSRRHHIKQEFNFTIHKKAQKLLDLIGTPEKQPFVPDPFQMEAIELIELNDVLVTAPTGAGKTYIAIEAIKKVFKNGGRSWYASPLKALSNSKYAEFSEIFGAENVGILTGDRKENPEAPIIVGTTEILRNQLYDVMHQGVHLNVDLVVMDEAHYLGDDDRGVVWEEVLIYLPTRVRILLLSATIRNAQEICNWLTWLRDTPCRWVSANERPVPLYPLFLFPHGELVPLMTEKGFFEKIDTVNPKHFGRTYFPDIVHTMEALRKANLLPAIFFLKSRADCERAITLCPPIHETSLSTTQEDFERELNRLLAQYPYLRDHKDLEILRTSRVGAHHGGQLPQWKMLLEKLMQGGYLEAIFSTSTVAAGVNFPARTVVITQSDRFNGHEFVPLTSTELHQMTGRAGRRGMDEAGFVLIVPGPYQDPRYIHDLLLSPPEPIESKVKVNFSMVLNLLLSHRPEDIRDLFAMSLATFQNISEEKPKVRRLRYRVERELSEWEDAMACKAGLDFIEVRRQYKQLSSRIKQMKSLASRKAIPDAIQHLLVRGRVFTTRQKVPYVILERPYPDSKYVKAIRLTLPLKTRKNIMKVSNIKVSNISYLHHHIERLPELSEKERWEEIIEKLTINDSSSMKPFLNPVDSAEYEIEEMMKARDTMPCSNCSLFGPCLKETDHPFTRIMHRCEALSNRITTIQDQLWRSFQYHFNFLVQEGYVNEKGHLTSDGLWASKLRLDQPLLISEGIRLGLFPEEDPSLLAALVAPFVMDRDRGQDMELTSLTYRYPELYERYFMLLRGIHGIRMRLQSWGFNTPPLPFWTVVTLYLWARGEEWEKVRDVTGIDEGDLVMLIVRVADHLNQIESLYETHPKIAESAKTARLAIMREPVIAI